MSPPVVAENTVDVTRRIATTASTQPRRREQPATAPDPERGQREACRAAAISLRMTVPITTPEIVKNSETPR